MGKLKVSSKCPFCENRLDGFTAVGHNRTPKPGEVTICVYCTAILQFGPKLELTHATEEVVEKVRSELKAAADFVQTRFN